MNPGVSQRRGFALPASSRGIKPTAVLLEPAGTPGAGMLEEDPERRCAVLVAAGKRADERD